MDMGLFVLSHSKSSKSPLTRLTSSAATQWVVAPRINLEEGGWGDGGGDGGGSPMEVVVVAVVVAVVVIE